MLENLAKVAVWLLMATAVVVVGWNEPLKYLFMTRAQVTEEEQSYRPRKAPSAMPVRPNARPRATPDPFSNSKPGTARGPQPPSHGLERSKGIGL